MTDSAASFTSMWRYKWALLSGPCRSLCRVKPAKELGKGGVAESDDIHTQLRGM
jgi:hypothetical protein